MNYNFDSSMYGLIHSVAIDNGVYGSYTRLSRATECGRCLCFLRLLWYKNHMYFMHTCVWHLHMCVQYTENSECH